MSRPARLYIDPPYHGESLSSVVSRAAQAYAVPYQRLIKELAAGESWPNRHNFDVDLNSPSSLEKNLSERVHGWISPTRSPWSIQGRKLAQRYRTAYCPLCFECDIAEKRTPYFRLSWASAWTTICWKHRSPLMEWKDPTGVHFRKLPESWIHGKFAKNGDVPAFHLQNLAITGAYFADSMGSFDSASLSDPDASTVLQVLWRLQSLVERPGAELFSNPSVNRSSDLEYRAFAVAHLGATQFSPRAEAPAACALYRAELAPLLSDKYDQMNYRTSPTSDLCIRNTSTVAWRRCYLWFAARTLATSSRYSSLITGRQRQTCEWPDWWGSELIPRLGEKTAQHVSKAAFQLNKSLSPPPKDETGA